MINNWIPKKKIVVATIVFLSLAIILYLVGFFIVVHEQKTVGNLFRGTESNAYKEEKARALKSILFSNTEEIQKLRGFFIQKGDEVKFIEQIEDIGRNAQIKFEIRSIELKSKTNDPLKEDVIIKMNIGGSWNGVIYFLDKMEKMPFGVSIENVDLDTDASGWIGSISMIVFREK